MRNQWWLTAALLVACESSVSVKSEPSRLGSPVTATSCARVPSACLTLQSQHYTDTTMTKKLMYACLVWVSACVTPAPTPNPPPTPPPAVGGATGSGGTPGAGGAVAPSTKTPEDLACANLKAIGCPEGAADDCGSMMKLRCSNPKVACQTACLTTAVDKPAAQKCGLACGRL